MPVYAFQLSSHLAGRAVSVSPAGSDSVVASGTLDGSASFSVSLPVGDYVAVAGSGQYAYRAAGTVDQGDIDRLADSALSSTLAPRLSRRIMPDPARLDTLAPAPTITTTAQATSTIAGAVLVTPDSGKFSYRGAGDFQFGTAFPDTLMYLPTSRMPHSYTSPQSVWSVEFGTDTSVFEVYFKYVTAAARYRLTIDGQRVIDTAQATGGTSVGGRHVLKVDFGSAKPRRVRIEFYTVPFGGIYVPPTATVWRQALGTRVLALGDSITGGSAENTAYGIGTWLQKASDLLGWGDPWNQAIGGTGYVNRGPSAGTTTDKFAARVAGDIAPYNPDVVIVWGGYNDNLETPANVGSEAAATFTAVKATTAKDVYVIGPWANNGSPTAGQGAIRDAIKSAATTAGLPFIDPFDGKVYNASGAVVASLGAWITGTGKSTAAANNGNADLYVGSDGVHPTDAGHAYLARRVAESVAALWAA